MIMLFSLTAFSRHSSTNHEVNETKENEINRININYLIFTVSFLLTTAFTGTFSVFVHYG